MLPTPHLCLEMVIFSPMLRALEELVTRIQLLQIEEKAFHNLIERLCYHL